MKNNVISSVQFYFSMFVTSIISLLLFDNTASFFNIFFIFLANVINILIISLYKREPGAFLKVILYLYFAIISISVTVKISHYMHNVLDSGPYWSLVVIIAVAVYFCTINGIEPLFRSSLIMGFFAVVFIIYIMFGFFDYINLNAIDKSLTFRFMPYLILLFPSASFAVFNKNIKDEKPWHLYVFSILSFVFLTYFNYMIACINKRYPIHHLTKAVKYGVFKGGDCLLLILITLSVIYILSISSLAISKNFIRKKTSIVLFLILISAGAILYLYLLVYIPQMAGELAVLTISLITLLSILLSNVKKNV